MADGEAEPRRALLAALRPVDPFGITRLHAAMAALIHLRIIGKQQAVGPTEPMVCCRKPAIEVRRALELQRRDMLHRLSSTASGWITNIWISAMKDSGRS